MLFPTHYVDGSILYVTKKDDTRPEEEASVLAYCGSDRADACLIRWGPFALTLVTAMVEGRREAIGLELLPAEVSPPPEDWVGNWLNRLEALSLLSPTPIAARTMRELPVGRLLAVRLAHVETIVQSASNSAVGLVSADGSSSASIEPGELAALADALEYVRAAAVGGSPARAIAEARDISVRTAEGRIRRARALGLLTPAQGTRGAAELTERALRLMEIVAPSEKAGD